MKAQKGTPRSAGAGREGFLEGGLMKPGRATHARKKDWQGGEEVKCDREVAIPGRKDSKSRHLHMKWHNAWRQLQSLALTQAGYGMARNKARATGGAPS